MVLTEQRLRVRGRLTEVTAQDHERWANAERRAFEQGQPEVAHEFHVAQAVCPVATLIMTSGYDRLMQMARRLA